MKGIDEKMKENYNGWSNWETWNFMLWYGDSLFDLVDEQKDEMEHLNHDEFYRWVYDIVSSFTEGIKNAYETIPAGFINDVISHSFTKINIIEIVDDIIENL